MMKTLMPLLVSVLMMMMMMIMKIQCSSAAVPEQQHPTCSASRQTDDIVLYQLSPMIWSPGCRRSWETEDGTSIVLQFQHDPNRVLNVTMASITLKNCTSVLRFMWQCTEIREKVNCSFNCSIPLLQEKPQPQIVNTTQLCFAEGVCVELRIIVAVVISTAVILAIALGFCIWKYVIKRKIRTAVETATYTSVTDQVKMEGG
ncbi:uncharacterized protein [Labrus bergylta]|uniref:uncharacterized protein isoform X2 n=1 Tax=Labrus bergylta TaxID=56723 RepID=UPI0009B2F39D|nr:uncharacterized protein LOC110001737 isoform X2 [Labrus bergylta]